MGHLSNRNVSTSEDIHRIATAFQQSRILLTAVELDLFTSISKGSLTSEKIAKKLGTGKRATDRLEGEEPASMIIARKKK
ncbi:MAG: hypothetical protein KKD92_03695 [Proteobacteria bacterium]|nr:hypothetical protein [Pseudomonadota bacterium]